MAPQDPSESLRVGPNDARPGRNHPKHDPSRPDLANFRPHSGPDRSLVVHRPCLARFRPTSAKVTKIGRTWANLCQSRSRMACIRPGCRRRRLAASQSHRGDPADAHAHGHPGASASEGEAHAQSRVLWESPLSPGGLHPRGRKSPPSRTRTPPSARGRSTHEEAQPKRAGAYDCEASRRRT